MPTRHHVAAHLPREHTDALKELAQRRNMTVSALAGSYIIKGLAIDTTPSCNDAAGALLLQAGAQPEHIQAIKELVSQNLHAFQEDA